MIAWWSVTLAVDDARERQQVQAGDVLGRPAVLRPPARQGGDRLYLSDHVAGQEA